MNNTEKARCKIQRGQTITAVTGLTILDSSIINFMGEGKETIETKEPLTISVQFKLTLRQLAGIDRVGGLTNIGRGENVKQLVLWGLEATDQDVGIADKHPVTGRTRDEVFSNPRGRHGRIPSD